MSLYAAVDDEITDAEADLAGHIGESAQCAHSPA
jgi:hypothetical protein